MYRNGTWPLPTHLGHQASCANDAPRADGDTAEYGDAPTNPAVVADGDGLPYGRHAPGPFALRDVWEGSAKVHPQSIGSSENAQGEKTGEPARVSELTRSELHEIQHLANDSAEGSANWPGVRSGMTGRNTVAKTARYRKA